MGRLRRRKLRRLLQHRQWQIKARDEIYDLVLKEIAIVILAWTHMETMLDGTIRLIHYHGGEGTVQSQLPVSLNVKIAYLKTAVRVFPALAPVADQVRQIREEIQKLKHLRHDCTHGIPRVHLRTRQLTFSRVRFAGSDIDISVTPYRPDQLAKAVYDALHLERDLLDLFGRIATIIGSKNAVKLHEKLSVRKSALALPPRDQPFSFD